MVLPSIIMSILVLPAQSRTVRLCREVTFYFHSFSPIATVKMCFRKTGQQSSLWIKPWRFTVRITVPINAYATILWSLIMSIAFAFSRGAGVGKVKMCAQVNAWFTLGYSFAPHCCRSSCGSRVTSALRKICATVTSHASHRLVFMWPPRMTSYSRQV